MEEHAMHVHRAEVLHTSILAAPEGVVALLGDVSRWFEWAPWVRAVTRRSALEWSLETDGGPMTVTFVAANAYGVLDHRVTLGTGVAVTNSMRVLANGSGSELVMVLIQHPTASTEEFERDLLAVRDDLERIRHAAEEAAAV